MRKSLSPKDIACRKSDCLAWGDAWSDAFGSPEIGSTWFISGPSASGKSTFVMQLARELCDIGSVLYLSYEEGIGLSFKQRMIRERITEVQGRFRVVIDDSYEEVEARLAKPKSSKFVIVDSFQYAGWTYEQTKRLVDRFPRKGFIFISQEYKGQPMGKAAVRLKYMAGLKIRTVGYRAYCQGRSVGDALAPYVIWEEGVMKSSLEY